MRKLVFFIFFCPSVLYAYPQFIGYGYTSCLTCHFNSQGNGQLNDYGRALWATEIAGRNFVGDLSEEELGQISGFLGKKQLPWWTRLGAKLRQIWIQSNPTRSTSQSRDILMQADVNLAFFANRSQTLGFFATVGYAGDALQQLNQVTGRGDDSYISREHYVRWMATQSLWVYLGKMDKVYGIRHANHTAYSRRQLGFNQNDQSHGLVLHYIKPKWELSLNIFGGDLLREEEFREQGASMMYEHNLNDTWRVGASALYSTSDAQDKQLFGVHSKLGMGHGLAFLNELGLISTSPATGGDGTLGYYMYNEAIQKIVRGYHLFFTAQAFKGDMTAQVPDSFKYGAGFLIFPLQRLELRIEMENTQNLMSGPMVREDAWAFYGQLHLSL